MTYAQYEEMRKPLLANLCEKQALYKKARREFGEESPQFKEAILCYNVAYDACQALTASARKQGAFKDSGMSF